MARPDPKPEIEVTPKMVEAGLLAYRTTRPHETSDFNEDQIVVEIFKAMRLREKSSR